jgi:hypothetical protein
MKSSSGPKSRTTLPIPDRPFTGPITFDAKDPNSKFPPIEPLRPKTKAPLAQILKLNGYSTAHAGKCHEVPAWETSEMGPFDAWPTGDGGFDAEVGPPGEATLPFIRCNDAQTRLPLTISLRRLEALAAA